MKYSTQTVYQIFYRIDRLLIEKDFSYWVKVNEDSGFSKEIEKKILEGKFDKSEISLLNKYLRLSKDFKLILDLIDLFNNPSKYENREEIINRIKNKADFDYDFFAKILPFEYKKILDYICKDNEIKEVRKITVSEFAKLFELEDAINNSKQSNNKKCALNNEELFIKLNDECNIKPEFIKNIISLFYETIITNNKSELLNEVNYEHILELEELYNNYSSYYKNNTENKNEIEFDQNTVNDALVLTERIKSYLEMKDDYFRLIDYLMSKGYTLYRIIELSNTLDNLWLVYTDDSIKTNIEVDRSSIKLQDRKNNNYMFKMLIETYKYLTTSSFISNTICNYKFDREYILDLSFRTKYFNDIIPAKVDNNFKQEHIGKLSPENKELVETYKNEYRKYYFELKNQELAKQNEHKLQTKLDKYVDFIKTLLDERPFSIKHYLDSKNLSKHTLHTALEELKKANHPLYDEYNRYTNEFLTGKDGKIMTLVNFIVSGIKYGVVENGKVRPFDLVDYYTIAGDFPIQKFVSLTFDNEVLSFFDKYKNDREYGRVTIDNVLKKEIVYKKNDKDGNLIFEYVATNQDKQKTIEALQKLGIPVTDHTYHILLKRYVFARYELDSYDTAQDTIAKQKEI